MRIRILVLLTFLGTAMPALPQTTPEQVPFEKVWKAISANSPALKAADEDVAGAVAAESRAKGHWFPRVYLDARTYRSDDPATGFMSLLESREIEMSDFNPSSLNHPTEKTYGQETLGVDWALFEGGARKAMASSAGKVKEAKGFERRAIRASTYAQTAGAYAALMTLEAEGRQLGRLQETVQDMLKRYFIGAKSNPVGYSGLLGLKTLVNRMEGLRAETRAKQAAIQGELTLQAGDGLGPWSVVPGKAPGFLEMALPGQTQPTDPAGVLAAQAAAEAMEKMKGAETARLLPRVAVFAEGALHQGERAASHGYTAGAYLQWNLFDAPSIKAREEADRRSKAASARAEGARLQAASDRVRAQESLKALVSNLELLEDSEALMEDQTQTAQTLFKNGSINALQMVEVFSRRVDLIDQKARAEMEFAQAKALSAVQSGFEESSNDKR